MLSFNLPKVFWAVSGLAAVQPHDPVIVFLSIVLSGYTHCLRMNYYVNFLGGLGSNGFHIK